MSKKHKDTYTLQKTVSLYHKFIKRVWRENPALLILDVFETIWSALIPYLHIYVSALFFDELAGERRIEKIQFYVLSILLIAVVISAVPAVINRIRVKHPLYLNYWLTSKQADMDFADADDPEVTLERDKIRQAQNTGRGFYNIRGECKQLLSSVFTILGGISLTASLFLIKVPASGGSLAVLNHPLFVLLMIAVMLGITYLSPVFNNLANRIWSSHATDHVQSNNEITYFSRLGYYQSDATDVRIYRQERQLEKWGACLKTAMFCSKSDFSKLAVRKIAPLNVLSQMTSVIFTGFTYLFVCLKALGGAFGVGAITQYVSSIGRVSSGVSQLIGTVGNMKNNAPFAEAAFAYLEKPNKMYMGSIPVEKRAFCEGGDNEYEIEFRNVSFKYPAAEQYSLKNVNLKFKVGSRLAVVGMNGSGKTTFIKLLCRLYDPTEGEILLNGINTRKYDYRDYMSIFSVVFQDFSLFHLKLGQVVAGALDYDREKVTNCLTQAGMGDRLTTLPHGLDTYLEKDYDKNGIEFSGGEKQKIAIARALYKESPFIILDEPTAALDPLAEAEIYGKFNEIAGDKTAIYISHRLSSCIFCDEIAVFHEGSIVQQGTHKTLLADESGKYHELWHAQAQYYTEG